MTDFEYREAKVQDWLNELETKYSKDYSTKLEEKLKKIKDIKDLENIDIDIDISEDLINFHILGKYLAVMELKTDFKKEFAKNDDVFSMPFKKAVEEMKKRKPILFKDLETTEKQEKENHFWIKKTTNLNITKDIYTKLIKSLEQGNTSDTFIKDVVSDYKLPKGYLEGVYRTVTTQAQQRGHLEQQLNMIDLGYKYGMFTSVLDGRETHKCHNMNGKILPIKEFIEKGLYPPLHYRCRSSIIQLDDDDLKDMNLKVTKNIEENPNRFSDYRPYFKEKKEVANFYKSRYNIKEEEVKILRNRLEEFDRGLRVSKKTKTILRTIQTETKEYTINEITNIKSKVKLYIEKGTLNRYSDIRELKKELKYIDDNLYEACNLMKLDSKKLKGLKAVIMDAERQVGAYAPNTNILYLNSLILGSEEKYESTLKNDYINRLACNDNILSNYIHELTHYLEHKRYGKNLIKREKNYKKIDELLKNVNLSKEISIYADTILNSKDKSKNTKYSEIYAESLVRHYFLSNSLVENIVLLMKEEGIL